MAQQVNFTLELDKAKDILLCHSSYARKYRSLIPCPHPNVVFVL